MSRLFSGVVLLSMLAGCALRPRFNEVVNAKTSGPEVKLALLDATSLQPLPNVKVEVGEGRARYQTTTDAKGHFTLPNKKNYADDNSLIVVSLPTGVRGYQLTVVPPEPSQNENAPTEAPGHSSSAAADGGMGDDVTRL